MTFSYSSLPKFSAIPHCAALRFTPPTADDARRCWASGPWLVVGTWLGTAALAVYLPVRRWRARKFEYYQAYGYAMEYEMAQRAYEEAQRDANGDGYYYPSCGWYNWRCRQAAYAYRQSNNNNNGGNNNNDNEQDTQVPNWYLFLGGQTEEGRRDREESGTDTGGTPALTFVYAWTLVMFAAIVLYGAVHLFTFRSRVPSSTRALILVLLLYAQFLLLHMVLLVQGVIQTDNRALQDSVYGWFGQRAVLMVYTDFGLIVYCGLATVGLTLHMLWLYRQQRRAQRVKDMGGEEEEPAPYVDMAAPRAVAIV